VGIGEAWLLVRQLSAANHRNLANGIADGLGRQGAERLCPFLPSLEILPIHQHAEAAPLAAAQVHSNSRILVLELVDRTSMSVFPSSRRRGCDPPRSLQG
jgi:hypothetical protein